MHPLLRMKKRRSVMAAEFENENENEEFPEVERYELRETGSYRFNANRREFVQVLGAGLMITAAAAQSAAQQPGGRGGQQARRDEKLAERFHIGADGVVTVLTSKVEVGQGARTQITQAVAEELHLPISQIKLVMADTELCPDDGGTAGSRTTPSTVPRVRNAAAAAREVLAAFAARRLEVARDQISCNAGVFSNASGKQITLAELAQDKEFAAQLNVAPPADVAIARVDQWKVLGTSTPKVMGREVVTGAARYASDVVLDEMLYGKVLRPASYNARLRSVDLAAAKSMPGVHVVQDGDFVGVAAATTWEANQALEAVAKSAQWDQPPHPSNAQLNEVLKRGGSGSGSGRSRGRGENGWGDRAAAMAAAKHKLNATYSIAYIQHAPMETRAAVAQWKDGKVTVWTGTQQPSRVRDELRQAFRLSGDAVRVIVPDTGGGFGGKHTGEAAVEAARLAKGAGRPVSIHWTREEEFTWAYFRPAGVIEVQAGLDGTGKLSSWDFVNYNSGGSSIESPYRAPNGRTQYVSSESPLRQGSYRALASTANTFAREAAIDELAEMAGADPLEFRLAHLEEGRLKDVLRSAAKKFDWARRRSAVAMNRGVGLACGTEKGSFVAACAEVEVVDRQIRVLSVCQAYECGAIQNPKNLQAQVEGCIIMGLGGALTEAMEFENGKITNASFSKYQVPRMKDVPQLDIVLVDRRDLPSLGAGETPIIAGAPAVANAVYQAAKVRCRSLPMKI
jgi:CO/xanthine dehydrogenase Mo-binding subunit